MTDAKTSDVDEGSKQTILAIDHGERRIGFAVRPAGSSIILPAGVIEVASEADALARVAVLLHERKPTLIVVGLPIHADMTQATVVKRFTRKLRKSYQGARWRFMDESLTSSGAEDRAREAGLKTRGRTIDDRAAALILESYLQSKDSTTTIADV